MGRARLAFAIRVNDLTHRGKNGLFQQLPKSPRKTDDIQ
jgi:hypothetical protein